MAGCRSRSPPRHRLRRSWRALPPATSGTTACICRPRRCGRPWSSRCGTCRGASCPIRPLTLWTRPVPLPASAQSGRGKQIPPSPGRTLPGWWRRPAACPWSGWGRRSGNGWTGWNPASMPRSWASRRLWRRWPGPSGAAAPGWGSRAAPWGPCSFWGPPAWARPPLPRPLLPAGSAAKKLCSSSICRSIRSSTPRPACWARLRATLATMRAVSSPKPSAAARTAWCSLMRSKRPTRISRISCCRSWRTASSPMPWAARPISAIPSSCSPPTWGHAFWRGRAPRWVLQRAARPCLKSSRPRPLRRPRSGSGPSWWGGWMSSSCSVPLQRTACVPSPRSCWASWKPVPPAMGIS